MVTTTVVTTAAIGITAVLSVPAVLALLVFLTTRELAKSGKSFFHGEVARCASIGVVPLVLAFVAIVVSSVVALL